MKTNCTSRPLRRPRSGSTLRLRALMDAQQKIEIGQRLKNLRDASPQTNASIADHVGVGERAVANWMAGSTGIQWANVKKLADLFGVDVNWLWTGHEHQPGPTPDPFPITAQASMDDLRQIEDAAAARHVEVMAELGEIRALLEAEGKRGRRDGRKAAGS